MKKKKKKYNRKYISFVKKYIKLYRIIMPCLFSFLLVTGLLVSFMIPLRPKYSEFEKRDLAKFPSLKISTLFNGDFFKDINTWFSDTFPMRDKMIEANNNFKGWYGFGNKIYGLNNNVEEAAPSSETAPEQSESSADNVESESQTESETEPEIPEQLGVVTQKLSNFVVIGDAAFEYCSFNQAVADKYAATINKAATSLAGTSKVYSMLVPTSMDITMPDKSRNSINSSNQSETMDYIYGKFNSGAMPINIYKNLRMHRDEYVYYRTDHHWTALGAYYAYQTYAETLGYTVRPLEKFKKTSYGEFLGSFYRDSRNPDMKKKPDDLEAYLPPYETTMTYTTTSGQKINWRLINDVSSYPVTEKYSAFTGGDNPMTVIENLSREKGKTCLVIKESFGNALIPYLVGHYRKVYVIDYRYYKSGIVSFAKQNGVNDVLFCNNMSAVRSDTLITRLGAIMN